MRIALFVSFIFVFLPILTQAGSLGQKLAGRILLNVEENGEAWYVYPENNRRYFLGRPNDAFAIMRELGLGITTADIQKLSQAGMPVEGDLALARKLSGKIVIEVEKNGEAWYIYPLDLKRYYLGRPADAFRIMRELSLGITREDLALVHKPGMSEAIDDFSSYEHGSVTVNGVAFPVDVVKIDLDNPDLKIAVNSALPCPTEASRATPQTYGAATLGSFVTAANAFAGINATYFEAGSSNKNYYFYPVYDSTRQELVNADQLKYWTTGPIIAFDENNKFYYFKDSREFPSPDWYRSGETDAAANFKKTYGVNMAAAIGNKPRLIEEGMNLLMEWDIDPKQRGVKAIRNALGFKAGTGASDKGTLYLVVAHNATLPDLADIMKTYKVDYALNLDGGLSAALWYNGEYMVGPGRNVPNAIVFASKK